MIYLKNSWYAAAWADEVSRTLFGRKILGESVLLYRKLDGTAVAIADRCPHRFAPLHLGQLKGDEVQCGYHGLQFDARGRCTLNPHGDKKIPQAARVRAYPLVEKFGLVWIWTGDIDLADESKIADYSHLVEPSHKTLKGHMMIDSNYQLMTDNLMDASHANYVHSNIIGTDAFLNAKHEVIQEGRTVHSNYWIPNADIPRSFVEYLKGVEFVDWWIDFQWDAPCMLKNRNGITPVGSSRNEGKEKIGTHLLTPETATTTHYFYGHTRNFDLDNKKIDEQMRNWQKVAFGEQDAPMIHAAQEEMGTIDLMSLNPVLLQIDAAAMRCRRLLSKLIDEERIASETTPKVPRTSEEVRPAKYVPIKSV